ncbi:MAG: cobalt transporter [Azospirillum sp.]|nr:cobalt transporter [Azospirillum sp.]
METFRRLFTVAVLAGLMAGGFVTLVHQFGTVPVILAAEVFEHGEAAGQATPGVVPHTEKSHTREGHNHDGHSHALGLGRDSGLAPPGHDHGEAAWEPADGWERTLYTALADILTGIGFALLLAAAFVLSGRRIDWRSGLGWGLAGFASITLAPGLGLPPEVPGTAAAALLDRQLWWLATAMLTGGGLALVFLDRRVVASAIGIALIVLPHLIGAPQPVEAISAAPPALAHQFVVAATVSSLLFWLALGGLAGFFYERSFKSA